MRSIMADDLYVIVAVRGRGITFISYVLFLVLLMCTPSSIDGTKEQYRRCREIGNHKSNNNNAASSSNNNHDLSGKSSRRSNTTIPIVPSLQGFYDSKCELSSLDTYSFALSDTITTIEGEGSRNRNQTRAVILVTSPSASLEKTLIIAAGLLSTNHAHVTIITGPQMPDTSLIRQVIFQHIPCHHHLVASLLLDFQQLNIEARHLPCPNNNILMMMQQQGNGNGGAPPYMMTQSPGDILLCNIQNSEIFIQAIYDVLNRINIDPSVFLMDVTCVAGLLAAEAMHIPAILLAEDTENFLRHIVGSPNDSRKVKTINSRLVSNDESSGSLQGFLGDFASWLWEIMSSPKVLYQSIASSIHDRLNSFDLTNSFIAFNRLRTKLKLKRIRLVSELYQVGGTILLVNSHTTTIRKENPISTEGSDSDTYYDQIIVERDSQSEQSNQQSVRWKHILPNLYTIPDPLLPPCVACTNTPASSQQQHRSDGGVNYKRKNSRKNKNKRKFSVGSEKGSHNTIPRLVLSVGFRNDEKGRSGSRRLMLAFWLAKQSIRRHSAASPCNSSVDISSCWNGPSDFLLIRPGTIPEVLPPGNDNILNDNSDFFDFDGNYNDEDSEITDFVFAEETTYLDTLSRHQPLAIISVCDNSNVWTQSLGPPVICIDTSWPARRIAVNAVRVLRDIYSSPQNFLSDSTKSHSNLEVGADSNASQHAVSQLDGLEWIVSTCNRLTLLRERRRYKWESGWHMKNDILHEMKELSGLSRRSNLDAIDDNERRLEESNKTLFGFFTVGVAWLILIISMLILPAKAYYQTFQRLWYRHDIGRKSLDWLWHLHSSLYKSPVSRYPSGGCNGMKSAQYENNKAIPDNRHNQYSHPNYSFIRNEIDHRLPDIDIAWKMWSAWVRDMKSTWTSRNNSKSRPSKIVNGKHITTSTPEMNGSHNGYHNNHSYSSSSDATNNPVNHNTSSNGSRKKRGTKKRH